MNDSAQEVDELLHRVRAGDEQAEDRLFEEVYTDLRRRAHRQRQRWKGDPSLQTTALVNETYEKLVGQENKAWETRSHFLALSARAMRHILIDQAKKKTAEKRGGDQSPLSLEELRERLGRDVAMTEAEGEAFVVLDEAMDRMEEEHPRAVRGVECRFFSGMTIEETAEALGISTATVSRDWKLAKAWLYREMKRIRGASSTGSDSASA